MKRDCRTCTWGAYSEPPKGRGFRSITCKYPVPHPMPLSWSYHDAECNSGKVYITHCEYYNDIEMGPNSKCGCWEPKKRGNA